jgi:peptidoglycan/xylan/chitin deacetylase (PgdA/CDA1 family)
MIIRLLKILISVLYLITKKITAVFGKTQDSQRCVVLYYHSVLESEKEKFIRQINYLSNKYYFVSVNSPNVITSKKNLISITFDDGLSSILKNALPELINRKIPTTIFIPAAKVGSYPRLHHTDLKNVTSEDARKEFQLSKSLLEKITRKEVVSFSFPYGSFNDELLTLAFDCGYSFVYTTEPERISFPTIRKVIGRVGVDPDDHFLEFKLKAAGAYSWLPRISRWKAKVKNFTAF